MPVVRVRKKKRREPSRLPRLAGMAALTLCLGGGLWWFAQFALEKVQAPKLVSGEPEYIDPTACTPCHAGIAAAYAKTGMARSIAMPSPQTLPTEDSFTDSGWTYTLSGTARSDAAGGETWTLSRQGGESGGAPQFLLSRGISYLIGSGRIARSLVSQNANGKVVELPAAWYAEDGGKLALAPGFRPASDDFRRELSPQCVFCHAAYPLAASTGSPLFPQLPAAAPRPIDCQRCHGPGRAHVAAAKAAGTALETIRRSIVHPGKLTPELQNDLCFQCHLLSTSRPLPAVVRRVERGLFSYRPGEPLSRYAFHFEEARGREDKFEVAHQGYRMRQSECYLRSNGKLTCQLCHDSHRAANDPLQPSRYQEACKSCHFPELEQKISAGAHPENADCTTCHMPRRRAEDMVHAVLTDHRIVRRPPAGLTDALQATVPPVHTGEVALYYPESIDIPADRDLYTALAQIRDGANPATGIERMETAIRTIQPASPVWLYELGMAHLRIGDTQKALDAFNQATRINSSFWPAHHGAGRALIRAGRAVEADERLRAALNARPADPEVLTDLGRAALGQSQRDPAAEYLRRAVAADPLATRAWILLGGLLRELRDTAGAEAAYRSALAASPTDPDANAGLAAILGATTRFDEARRHYGMALSSDPKHAVALLGYGLLLATTGDQREARQYLEQAARSKDAAIAEQARKGLGELP